MKIRVVEADDGELHGFIITLTKTVNNMGINLATLKSRDRDSPGIATVIADVEFRMRRLNALLQALIEAEREQSSG